MNRRNFFASLFAPIVAKDFLAEEPTRIDIMDPANLTANGYMIELEQAIARLEDFRIRISRVHDYTRFEPEGVDLRHHIFLRPKVRSAAEKRWRAEYRRARIRARTHRDRSAV